MKKIKEMVLGFDLGVHSNDKLIVAIPFIFCFIFLYMLLPGDRLFFVHWISAYCLGVMIFFIGRSSGTKKSLREMLHFLFPRKVWTHPSTINDCIIAVFNGFFAPSLYVVFNILPLAAAGSIGFWVGDALNLSQSQEMPTAGIIVLYTFSMLVASDFSYYWAHRWAHKIPVWWEFHKVHHSAEVMTPITLARYHPLDNLLYVGFRRFGQLFLSGFFLYFYPTMPGTITVLSSNLFIVTLDFFGNNLRHSHIWLSFGPRVERFIISPALHQIHHSDAPKHFDKNFGATLSVWDWIFGTLYVPEGKEEIVFGLGQDKQTEEFDTVPKLLVGPFLRAFDLIKQKKALKWAIKKPSSE